MNRKEKIVQDYVPASSGIKNPDRERILDGLRIIEFERTGIGGAESHEGERCIQNVEGVIGFLPEADAGLFDRPGFVNASDIGDFLRTAAHVFDGQSRGGLAVEEQLRAYPGGSGSRARDS